MHIDNTLIYDDQIDFAFRINKGWKGGNILNVSEIQVLVQQYGKIITNCSNDS